MDTVTPRITIIIPSYNQGQYIEETILSVINQYYSNVELIIIDGSSTDNTVEIIKKYDERIAFWVSEPDSGQADAINKGLSKATGDIVNWINSDDFLEPGALKKIAEFFVNNPDKEVLCGFTHCFYDEDKSTSHTYRMGLKDSATETILNVEMNQPGTFYKMSVFKDLNGVNTSLRYVFDNELWFRYLIKNGISKVGRSNELIAHFRLHKTSKSVYDGFVAFEKESQAIWQFLGSQFEISIALQMNLKAEFAVNYYQSTTWEGGEFDVVIFENRLCAKYLLNLIETGNYNLARRGWVYSSNLNIFLTKRVKYSTFLKVFLFPGFFKN
jgi:glycosyltransferase involved in cell wall biosynthesis